jgi:hypothetical protein
MQPFRILQEATKAVPAMRYALALTGILAVVAIAKASQVDARVSVFGAIITLGLMVAMVVFARLTRIAPSHFLKPVLVMMWSFLVLVVAQAALLFSAVSFQTPKPLHDWLFRGNSRPLDPVEISELEVSPETIKAAEVALETKDHLQAWNLIETALQAAPKSAAGLDVQARIAMDWLRSNFALFDMADRISPCLYRTIDCFDKAFAADAWAHIGWLNYLKYRAGYPMDFEDPFRKALELDPGNIFAHTMRGYALVWKLEPPQAGDFENASKHFEAAVQSGKQKDYVRRLQLAALGSTRMNEHILAFIQIIDGIRRSGESLSFGQRSDVLKHVYWSERRAVLGNIESSQPVLPAAQHLATILWLKEDFDPKLASVDFITARLTEQAGNRTGALAIYRSMASKDYRAVNRDNFADDVRKGITRCQAEK